MPSFRRVSFSEKPEYSRLPRDDESYVMHAFSRHASRCNSCHDPFQVYKTGGTLCPKGHQRALDVAQYVYSKGGLAFSSIDRERNQRTQIEIPAGCEPVRSLLKAMDRGLRVMKRAPSTSYDKTYYVPARPVTEIRPRAQRRPSTKELRLETVEPPSQPRPRYSRAPSYASSRSSRSASPTAARPGLSRYNTYSSSRDSYRRPSYSSSSSRGSSPNNSRGSSRNNSISSQSSYGSYEAPARKSSLSRDYPSPSKTTRGLSSYFRLPKSNSRDDKYYKAPVYYRIAPIEPKSAPAVPPKDSDAYTYRRRR